MQFLNLLLTIFYYHLLLIKLGSTIKFEETQNATGTSELSLDITITSKDIKLNTINFYREIELKESQSCKLNIRAMLYNEIKVNIGFSMIEVHSMIDSVSFKQIHKNKYFNNQSGTNLGFIIENENIFNNTGEFMIENLNTDIQVKLAVVLLVYSLNVPRPGGCQLETKLPTLTVELEDQFFNVYTPSAAPPINIINDTNNFCKFNSSKSNIKIIYESFYMYLPKHDFTYQTYFDGVKKMLTYNGTQHFAFEENRVSRELGGSHKSYIAVPGTGMVVNTVASIMVDDSLLEKVAYVPAVTYSCEKNFLKYCSILSDSLVINLFSWSLIIIGIAKCFDITSVMSDSIIISVFLCYKIAQQFDIESHFGFYFTLILGILCVFLIFFVTIAFPPLLIVSRIISYLIFSIITGNLILYQTSKNFHYGWDTATFITYLGVSVILCLSLCTPFFPVSVIVNIILGAYYFISGCLLLNRSNLVLIVANYFRKTNFKNFKVVNRMPSTEYVDIIIFQIAILLIVVGLLIKYIKHKNLSRNLDLSLEESNERSSLLNTSMGSEEVFESPETSRQR